jgi:hypothetical protein
LRWCSPFSQAPAPATLTIAGDVQTPVSVSIDDLQKMPRTSVTMAEHGHETRYDGVLLSALLARAGVPLGPALGGKALSTYVLASASDGYQVVFSLGELDPALTHNDIIVADASDGHALAATQGPLRIVSPHDARGARSLRMLQRIDVVQLRK